MGNQLALPQRQQQDYLADLPSLVFKESLGGGRFMKSMLCIHDDDGQVVVKAYYKRGDTTSLRDYELQLVQMRERLTAVAAPVKPHVLPFTWMVETERAAYLMRRYCFANLYHRLSSRPFLSDIEKRWIAFQLLAALAQAHERGVYHGDIKAENVLLTSWSWLYLADFAPYKPAHLPANNPADYSYFYDAGGRRRCYLAPERFYESDTDTAQLANEPLRSSMDIFSAGCVIAEMFNDGKALFDLGKLLAYRRGEHDPAPNLAQLDPPIRDLVLHMIQLDPGARLSAAAYLSTWGPRIFPPYFDSFLHDFFYAALGMDPDARIAMLANAMPSILHEMQVGGAPSTAQSMEATAQQREEKSSEDLPTDADGVEPSTAPTPPTAPALSLLSNVGTVQMNVQDLLGRLKDAEERSTEPGLSGSFFAAEYTLADAEEEEDARLGVASDRPLPRPEYDVATREFFEFQYRESSGRDFREKDVESVDGSMPGMSAASPPQRREDVRLPEPTGWLWTSDWLVDKQSGPSDAEGWVYRRAGDGGSPAGPGPSTLHALYGWSTHGGTHHNWRRRRWIRRCQRALPPPQVSSYGEGGGKPHGMVLLAALLCSSLRGMRLMEESKIVGIKTLSEVATMCDDDARLQRIVPYLLAMMSDGQAGVRCAALRAVAAVLRHVGSLPPGDLKIFNEYILPSLSMVPSDPEEWVRIEYAALISDLATSAHRLLMGLHHTADQAQPHDPNAPEVLKYEEEVAQLRMGVEKVVHELVVGQKSSSTTRRTILHHIHELQAFLGRRECNDFLLPTMITFLNNRDWLLRGSFFTHIPAMAEAAGPGGLEAFLMPCLEQALADEEAAVIAEAVAFLTAITERRQVRHRALLKALAKVAPRLLLHPSCAVRGAVVDFLAAAAKFLTPARAHAQLLPLVLPACETEPLTLTDPLVIASCLRPAEEKPEKKDPHAPAAPSVTSTPGAGASPRTPTTVTRVTAPARVPGVPALPALTPTLPVVPNGVPPRAPRRKDGKMEEGGYVIRLSQPVPEYVLQLEKGWQRPGASRLTAAVQGLAQRDSLSSGGGVSCNPALPESQVTVNRIVAAAKRVAASGGEMQLAPGLLTREEPFSFQGAAPLPAPGVSDAIGAAIHTSIPAQGAVGATAAWVPWHPRGVLVAHLAEHRSAVNRIAVAGNSAFIATASNDETVKIWDVRRLEKDVLFRSRLTYNAQAGRILSCCACEDSQSVASASANGSVHVWRVEYTTRTGGSPDRYTAIVGKRRVEAGEGACVEVTCWGGLLLYITQRGGIHALDLRSPRDAWTLPCKPNEGQVERMACDPEGANWLLTGSSVGRLTLWDTRFQLPVFAWAHPARAPVEALAPALAPPARLRLPGETLACPLVYVSAGQNEVGLWDVEHGRCHQVLRSHALDEPAEVHREEPVALQRVRGYEPKTMDPSSLSRHLGIPDLQSPGGRAKGCRTLLPTSAGALLAGGTDCCIRLWESSKPEASYMVAGPPVLLRKHAGEAEPRSAAVTYHYQQKEVRGVPVVEEECVPLGVDQQGGTVFGDTERLAALCHRDAVLHLTKVDLGEPVLLSCSQDGVVKAWK